MHYESKDSKLIEIVKKWSPTVYTYGVLIIIGWMVINLSLVGYHDLFGESSLPTADLSSQNDQDATWFNAMVHPVIKSPYNQIIFKGLFYLAVWIIIFLVAPIPFFHLKRFKIFNLEIELEKQQQSIARYVDISLAKNKFMTYLTSDEAFGKMLYFYNPETAKISFRKTVEYFLSEMKNNYISEFNLSFEWQICRPDDIDDLQVKELAAESKEKKEAVILNNKGDHSKYNYLVFYCEQEDMVCELYSYRTEFEPSDRYIIEMMFHVVSKYVEGLEYAIAYTGLELNQEETS